MDDKEGMVDMSDSFVFGCPHIVWISNDWEWVRLEPGIDFVMQWDIKEILLVFIKENQLH